MSVSPKEREPGELSMGSGTRGFCSHPTASTQVTQLCAEEEKASNSVKQLADSVTLTTEKETYQSFPRAAL